MAETVLRAFLVEAGLDGAVSLDSAGTGNWNIGRPMYSQARAVLASRGHDGSGHRARQFRASWLAQRDLVLAMDTDNLAVLRRLARPADSDRIRLFGEVGGLAQTDGEIPDPYGGNAAEFDYVLDLISTAAPVIIARLAQLLEPANPASVSSASGDVVSGASDDIVSGISSAGRCGPDRPGAPA